MTQEQFDQKKKELKEQFRREKLKMFLVWLVYNVITMSIIVFVTVKFFPLRYPFAIAIGFSSVFVSTWIWAKNSVVLGKTEREQYVLLQDEQPMRRFKYDD